MKKIIVRVKGGLGNQLFCYAFGRRLALANDAELVIDDVTGFARDFAYRRRYMLDHFRIPARKATPMERLEPFERYRRGVKKWLSRRKPFAERCYLEQEGNEFDQRFLTQCVKGALYLDGYWQDERYFADVAPIIREDFLFVPPSDDANLRMATHIRSTTSIALHVRWFEVGEFKGQNVPLEYYKKSISLIDSKVNGAKYFLFSDDPISAQKKLGIPEERLICVTHNKGDEMSYADLWLMSQCRHFITANSSFSWWGAWLSRNLNKIVVAPNVKTGTVLSAPAGWFTV